MAVSLTRRSFGQLSTGEDVTAFDLSREGISITVMSFGAALQAVRVPDAQGRSEDVTLGYDDLEQYERVPQHFGVSVGRFANRIAKGRFTLDGKAYELETNNGPNHLHGGSSGFGMRNWRVDDHGEAPNPFVVFALTSPDGDAGYPGKVEARARYELTATGELTLTYEATTDAPTIVNLTNHVYFNLGGPAAGDVLDHEVTIAAETYLPTDKTAIPTGERRPVVGTPFDFRAPRSIAEGVRDGSDEQIRIGRGFDHCYCLADEHRKEPVGAVRLTDRRSGRCLDFLTTAPGVQFYSGNFLDGTAAGKRGRMIRQGDGLCIEPQLFPDSSNQPDFPTARLDPGETFSQVSVYRFGTL
ncbi:MAG: galactose mutarotase [Fulvimarina manganoxydans]|uniref:aldose epimerase family protein n=1 Tax=Fulvimarina manganoxydans TaxID=937218 RepID=UPI0023575A3D|nr:aldose epimerase family protein [Fulvimarina manganoxydans]MCK5933410.1 galactose mutarotase [Fulvimarina manganoxydans]